MPDVLTKGTNGNIIIMTGKEWYYGTGKHKH